VDRESGLEPQETLYARSRVVLVAASELSAPGSVRRRRRARPVSTAHRLGVPLPGRVFVIGVTDHRLVIWKTSPWLARPQHVAVSLPLDSIASIQPTGWFGRRRMSVLLDRDVLLVVGPLWSRGLPGLAAAVTDRQALR
jgi:hypothetical protein